MGDLHAIPDHYRLPSVLSRRVHPSPEFPITNDAFNTWYQQFRRTALEPARVDFCRLLTEEIARLEIEFGPGRFKSPDSRVKDPSRLWTKMNLPKYRDAIVSLDSISDVIDDLVGVRIICTNKSDVDKIRKALESWNRMSVAEHESVSGLAVETDSERDYIQNPKDSGYRAYHVNLLAGVNRVGGTLTVKGELQIRTLLQDGWGELTHEDTYKPGQSVPELVSVLALRMGELLATVDDIAEDIQRDLSRVSQESIDPQRSSAPAIQVEPDSLVSMDVVVNELTAIVNELEKPASLAQLASKLRSTFGPEVSAYWKRSGGTFKAFLHDALPAVEIVPTPPSYVIPLGVEADETWPQVLRDALESPSTATLDS